jgi:hypothetical protein
LLFDDFDINLPDFGRANLTHFFFLLPVRCLTKILLLRVVNEFLDKVMNERFVDSEHIRFHCRSEVLKTVMNIRLVQIGIIFDKIAITINFLDCEILSFKIIGKFLEFSKDGLMLLLNLFLKGTIFHI